MIPIRFGSPERQLFGIYQKPIGMIERVECVVLCNPFGQEAIRCHRLFKVLADRLARSGFYVLRFDYFATGDSAGDDCEGDLAGWSEDVLTASEEIMRRSGCLQISWFGLRLGASIAALASVKASRPPFRMILWDPIVDGTFYRQSLESANVEAFKQAYGIRWELENWLRSKVLLESKTESLGFPITAILAEQLNAMSVSSFGGLKFAQASLFSGPDVRDVMLLYQRLLANNLSVKIAKIDSEILWASNEAMNTAIVPADVLQLIITAFQD